MLRPPPTLARLTARIERARQGLEHRDALLQQDVVIGMHLAKPFDNPADGRPLGGPIPRFFHIQVVHDLPETLDGRTTQTETLS